MSQRYLVGAFVIIVVLSGLHRNGSVAAQGPSDYIVVLHDDVPNVPAVAAQHVNLYGVSARYVYQYALKGYAATIPAQALDAIRRDPRVAFIAEDRPVQAVAETLPTGVDRIDAETILSSSYSWNFAVAVIDTGSGPHSDVNVVGGTNCSGTVTRTSPDLCPPRMTKC